MSVGPLIPAQILNFQFALGQLRHLYTNLKGGQVSDPTGLADGLLSPQIGHLEELYHQHFCLLQRCMMLESERDEWRNRANAQNVEAESYSRRTQAAEARCAELEAELEASCSRESELLSMSVKDARRIAELEEALTWYGEKAEGCRKLGSIGDPARQALDADGGKRARAALSADGAASP